MRGFFKNHLFLILIILLATFARIFMLSSNPIGFADDEAASGYNAYSILKTGRDEWGKLFPFPVIESFGDWKLEVNIFLTVISETVFGLNEFATRLPAAVIGISAVFITYLLAKKIFDKKTGLVAALLLAISPWHITASRHAFESHFLTFFIPLSTYFFLKSFENRKYFFFSIVSFGFCLYVYRSAWVFIPIFLTFLILVHKNNIKDFKKLFLKSIIILILLAAPLISTITSFSGQSRFLQESFVTGITRIGIDNEINEKRGICKSNIPNIICTLVYNKYFAIGSAYVNNYMGNLSLQTYFEKGNSTGFQSFSSRSLFYFFELPILLVGLYRVIFQKYKKAKLLLAWIIIAPIAASATGVGNFGRLNLIMPAPQIIEALGLTMLFSKINQNLAKRTVLIFVFLVISFSFGKFLIDNFYIESFYNSRYERYGYKSLFNYLKINENKYSNILISQKIDNSHQYIQYLYFDKIDPNFFRSTVDRQRSTEGWVDVKSIGKYKFIPSIPDVLPKIPKNTLGVVGENEVQYPIPPKFIIRDLRGDILFKIYDIDQVKEKLQVLN